MDNFIDIPFERPLARGCGTHLLIAAYIVFALVTTMIVAFQFSGDMAELAGIGMAAMLLAPVAVYAYRSDQNRKRHLAACKNEVDLRTTISYLEERRALQPYAHLTSDVIGAWARAGLAGNVIRIAAPQHLAPVEPLIIDFEARRLDEADVGFQELERAVASPNTTQTLADPVTQEEAENQWQFRRFRRNFSLAGGWWHFLTFLPFGWIAWDNARSGSYGVAAFFGAVILVYLLAGTRAISGTWSQLFFVPGAVVVRGASLWGRNWSVRLFKRTETVLCVVRGAMPSQWAVILSDGSNFRSELVTPAERDLLLRAWMSPVPPPALERLGDFK